MVWQPMVLSALVSIGSYYAQDIFVVRGRNHWTIVLSLTLTAYEKCNPNPAHVLLQHPIPYRAHNPHSTPTPSPADGLGHPLHPHAAGFDLVLPGGLPLQCGLRSILRRSASTLTALGGFFHVSPEFRQDVVGSLPLDPSLSPRSEPPV